MPRLRRSNPNAPGIRRRRVGRGFTYHRADGEKVTDPEVLARIAALAIPPAWTDVWICPWANGHIQAMGTDARGRRQYRYHDVWRIRRDAEKFDHMLVFAQALPRLREVVAEHLASPDLTRDRVLACAARLLDLGFFRIGTEGYAEENNTFGLATMRKKHVCVDGDVVTFDFTAKSGKRRIQSVVDPDVAAVVRELKDRRGGGFELLAFRDGGRWVDIKSTDINAYLKQHTGEDITAKDFRTWNATVLCAVGLAVSTAARSDSARKRAVARAVKEVAHYLGNTPAVCRKSYIDPRIVDRYHAGATVQDALVALEDDNVVVGSGTTQSSVEAAVLDLLAEESAGARAA
ncbi:MAG: DNA topoisomerase IB [Actinobacteria bacterium]|nr:DNA topoisomerase IB [Actinomycetota bacterium]